MSIAVVSLISVVGGALLAYWQWTRYESASGTLQNLGYVLQWPLFGFFPGFMFWRIHRAAQRERALDAALDADIADIADLDAETHAMTDVEASQPATALAALDRAKEPTKVDPRLTYTQNRTVTYVAEEDQELIAYNRRLADLADQEQRHAG